MPNKRPHQLIAAAFLLIGALLGYGAAERGGLGWLLLWPAGNCLAVGAAYFTVAGRVFGKRADGSMHPLVVAWMLPFLLVNWATWHVQVLLSREAPLHEVAPRLFLGRRVFDRELPAAVNLVVDLTAEFPRPAYRDGVAYAALPTLDAFVPPREDFLRLAREIAGHPGTAVVHCANGRGRSAALAAAVMLLRGDAADLADAERKIVFARPGCAWHPAQRRLLESLREELHP